MSSAGLKTHRLPSQTYNPATAGVSATTAGASSTIPDPAIRNRNNIIAMALLGLGAVMLLGNIFPASGNIKGSLILFALASCFLFFSFWKRVYGLMIPGAVLAGLSSGVAFASLTGGASVLWGLSLGFFAVLFLGRAMFNKMGQWPIYVAVPLLAIGVIIAASSISGFFFGALIWMPFLLIGAGLYLGWLKK